MKIQNGSFAAAMNAVAGAAKDTDYDNTTSGLEADKVQSAIDTLLERIKVLENRKQSHIGMIVQSSKLDTMEKVISEYGGTTWVKIEGRFLLGDSSSHAIDSTGGSESVSYTPAGTVAKHTLTVNEIPSHSHTYSYSYADGWTYGGGSLGNVRNLNRDLSTANTGGGQGHNHGWTGTKATIATMPPYKAVYIWERTA